MSLLQACTSQRGIIVLVLLVLLIASVFQLSRQEVIDFSSLHNDLINFKNRPNPQEESSSIPESSTTSLFTSTFYDIALKHGTDKVTEHSYHNMYQKYLEPMRSRKLKMLEIGLGCNMWYGPGASYYTWLEYLPNVDLYFIEYDAACAERWATETTGATIVAGDQANVTMLNEFKKTYGTDFDIIIDDGGHTMDQQITSLDHLFDAVKPGGIYFIEDLHTSYLANYGGIAGDPGTMMEHIKVHLDELIQDTGKEPVMKHVYSVDCMRQVCAFSKKLPDGDY